MLAELFLVASLYTNVRGLIAQHDLVSADRVARAYQSQTGITPELAASLSLLARAELELKQYDLAETYAGEVRGLSDKLLRARKLDAEPFLPLALGAAIEVHAQTLAARGERSEGVTYLKQQLALFRATSLYERIQKNINLLSMEGKPAPPLDTAEWINAKPPALAALHGHPVLLFFWAHWCSDCKGEIAVLADIQRKFASQGLSIVAPTKLYGYVAKGEDAGPDVEKRYIEQVWRQFYSILGNVPAPVSAANFLEYGASTTPTLVLLDSAGSVRFYHPGAITEAELSERIQALLKK